MGRSLIRDRHGGTAVELALILPLLVLILSAGLEVGRVLWIRQGLDFAVQDAARTALVNQTLSVTAVQALTQARFASVCSDLPLTVTVGQDAGAVTITAQAHVMPVLAGLVPTGGLWLSATTHLPR